MTTMENNDNNGAAKTEAVEIPAALRPDLTVRKAFALPLEVEFDGRFLNIWDADGSLVAGNVSSEDRAAALVDSVHHRARGGACAFCYATFGEFGDYPSEDAFRDTVARHLLSCEKHPIAVFSAKYLFLRAAYEMLAEHALNATPIDAAWTPANVLEILDTELEPTEWIAFTEGMKARADELNALAGEDQPADAEASPEAGV